MSSSHFSTKAHGKWILTGEHAVIRGSGAIVFPIPQYELTLNYYIHGSRRASFEGHCSKTMDTLFWRVIHCGLDATSKTLDDVQGHFKLQNSIPLGAGLGASAALCVTIARWFAWKQWILECEIFTFARMLEDLFHQKSSGLDIAGCANTQGICFQQGSFSTLHQTWKPKWYLSFSGQIGVTAECVSKVTALFDNHPKKAASIDESMKQSVVYATKSLSQTSNTKKQLQLLVNAIELAYQCFEQWGLITPTLETQMSQLKSQGALATKPTGSGAGGYILSLWDMTPPKVLNDTLIAL